MLKLYSELARVYHEMYQVIFDYPKVFQFYNRILKKYNSKSVLEMACGSGNLAPYFLKVKYSYVGVDFSPEMLAIAKDIAPKAKFVRGDMRSIKFRKKFDAVIISGKSISYMVTNEDVQNTLQSIYKVLNKGGILIFDNFNAQKVVSLKRKRFVQKIEYNGRKYKRVSIKTPNLNHGWTENWKAIYTVKEKGKETQTFTDNSLIRSFTKEEIQLFLKLYRLEVEKFIDQDSVFTTIARK